MLMKISVCDSISAISEIQEQLQTDTMESYTSGVSETEKKDSVNIL